MPVRCTKEPSPTGVRLYSDKWPRDLIRGGVAVRLQEGDFVVRRHAEVTHRQAVRRAPDDAVAATDAPLLVHHHHGGSGAHLLLREADDLAVPVNRVDAA